MGEATHSDGKLVVLGIETSCDETAAAVVERRGEAQGRILSNVVRSQLAEHRAYGGVVPEIAARAHVSCLDHIIKAALAEAGLGLDDIDGIAATAGPGLIGGVLVGLGTAKALALATGKPLIAVNHLEAHALTPGLTEGLKAALSLARSSRAAIPNSWQWTGSGTTGATAPPSTMHWERPLTRRQSFLISTIRAVQRWRPRPVSVMLDASISRAR